MRNGLGLKFSIPFSLILLLCLALVAGCADSSGNESDQDLLDDDDDQGEGGLPGVRLFLDCSADARFFDAPYPIEFMRRDDGTLRFVRLDNPRRNALMTHYIEQADAKTKGFSRVAAIYMRFDGEINAAALPQTWAESITDGARAFVINVDPDSSNLGARVPLRYSFRHEATTYTPSDLLAMMPPAGLTLDADTLYAAVVLRSLGDALGQPLGSPPELEALKLGQAPSGFHGPAAAAAFAHLWPVIEGQGIDSDQVAAATVFRTGDVLPEMLALRQAVSELPDPDYYGLRLLREFDDYYVLEGQTVLPIWQNGNRNYFLGGGEIVFVNGEPIKQWDEQVRFCLTVPKSPMPEAGFPLLFYVNGAGGRYTQVVDRGTSAERQQGIEGRGPALYLARRGIACLSIEAATVGPRGVLGDFSDLYFFNFLNLVAYRDNARQAASEYCMLPKLARGLEVPAALCPDSPTGGGPLRFDQESFFLFGHSTGASIGELALAVEPSYRSGVFSGAGATWVQNLTLKEHPIPFRLLVALLTGMPLNEFDDFHPVATLFQTMCEPAEAALFAQHWIRDPLPGNEPKDVLLIGGYIDGYFLPPMISALTLAAGFDVAQPLCDLDVLGAIELSGREVLPTPVSGNIAVNGAEFTGVLVQYPQPPGIDGHYVPFELNRPKHQYSCFLRAAVDTGRAVLVEANDDPFAACGYPGEAAP
ncbi:MAG: hypothetical protein P9M14_10635 [Candidatus Alcyoniella australis]|nr:hypothetical protein [Candidatus Alcyoniella australis]